MSMTGFYPNGEAPLKPTQLPETVQQIANSLKAADRRTIDSRELVQRAMDSRETMRRSVDAKDQRSQLAGIVCEDRTKEKVISEEKQVGVTQERFGLTDKIICFFI